MRVPRSGDGWIAYRSFDAADAEAKLSLGVLFGLNDTSADSTLKVRFELTF